jgi:hypothetical protein
MDPLTPYLIAVPTLLIVSVVASKGAGRFGIPVLSMFLLIGMVAGREGPGGLPFSNLVLAQTLGVIALILILHSGGLGTRLDDVRTIRRSALVLSNDRRAGRERPGRTVFGRFLGRDCCTASCLARRSRRPTSPQYSRSSGRAT